MEQGLPYFKNKVRQNRKEGQEYEIENKETDMKKDIKTEKQLINVIQIKWKH